MGDILGNLGQAVLRAGEWGRAAEIFHRELSAAREAGDRFAEKLALEHLGTALAGAGDPARALSAFAGALDLARQVGDRHQEPALLWLMAVQHAEAGRRDPALARAQEAVDLLERSGHPQAALHAEHLQQYRSGAAPLFGPNAPRDGQVRPPAKAPGPLQMALSASASLAKFLIARAKVVDDATLQGRLRTCSTCEHHTGLRCRVCGCFTNVKTRMPHEECPIGHWPRAMVAPSPPP